MPLSTQQTRKWRRLFCLATDMSDLSGEKSVVLSPVQISSPSSYLSKKLDSCSLVPRKSFGIPSEPVGFTMNTSLSCKMAKVHFLLCSITFLNPSCLVKYVILFDSEISSMNLLEKSLMGSSISMSVYDIASSPAIF